MLDLGYDYCVLHARTPVSVSVSRVKLNVGKLFLSFGIEQTLFYCMRFCKQS